jgi:signal transduction histidine kinase
MRLPLPRGFAADIALALVLLAVGQAEVWLGWRAGGIGLAADGSRPLEALMVAAFTAPLAVRRRAPVTAVSTLAAAIIVQVAFVARELPLLPGLLPLAVANYSAAAWGRARWRLAGLAAAAAATIVLTVRVPEEHSSGEILFSAFVIAGTWLLGDLARSRHRRAEHFAERARRLEVERDEWALEAVAAERSRIARELHDVVAHTVSLMGVQAGAARLLVDEDPERARAALRQIETSARESVDELQRLLTFVREEGAAPALEPQPTLDQLEGLAAQVRAAGLAVELVIDAVPRAVPPGVALAAYRIVQEALTNTLKHAEAARACIRLAYDGAGDALEIQISDDGRGAPAANGHRGHGLVGMRERAALYGGTLQAESKPSGGFSIVARLPLGSP